MAEKTGPSAPQAAQGGFPEAPPSYEATVGGAGGFVAPPVGPDGKGMYQPPPMQHQQQQGVPPPAGLGGPQTVIVQYMNPPNFGHNPVNMTCPNCQCQIRTSTDSEPGPMAWILAGVLCVVGLWPCACIPCCIDSLNSVTHRCPNCKHFLGRYKGGL
jgi:lipopolysaccharide-induced tumor necrosis factor-alpha factor